MAGKKPESKKKGLGCLPRLIIFLVILILVVYAAGKFLFPTERVKAEIVQRASKMLGRTVELDNLSFSLLPTPSLDMRGFRIYNPEEFPGAEFVTVDRLACGLKIMPLFRKQLVFSEIAIEHPVIHLRKTIDGRTNYSFTLNTGGQPVETPVGTKKKVSSEEAALTVFAFDWAAIKNGDLIYIDDSAQSKTTLSNFSLETRLNVEADGKSGHSTGTLRIPSLNSTLVPEKVPLDINIAYNADIDFQHADLVLKNTTMEINGVPFAIDATVRNLIDPSSVFASIKAADVSLEPLVQYIPSSENFDTKQLRLQGKISGEMEARIEFGPQREPYLNGNFDFKDLTVGYQTVAARVHFDDFKVGFDFDTVSFASEGGKLSDRDFYLAGSVKNWDDPVFDIKTRGSYDLAGILPFMDKTYGHQLSGDLRFNLAAAGQKSKWADTRLAGTIAVDKAYYDNDSITSPLERLDLMMTIGDRKTTVDSMYIVYPGVRATLTGTLKNGFAHLLQPRGGYPKPYLDFKLKSPLVNYDILVPEDDALPASTAAGTTEMAAPIFLPDIEAGGTVAIDTLVYSQVDLTNITGDVAYKDGIITFTNARGDIYSGKVSGAGTVDITDMYQPAIKCEFTANNVEANDFMARFADLDGHLYGKMNLDGTLSGRGAEFPDFIKTLSADGNVDLKDGKLVNFDLINDMAKQFGFKTFQEEDIRQLVSAVKIRDGRLLLDGTKVFSKMGDWNIGGTVGFLEKKLDLFMGVYLSPEFSKNLNLMGGLLEDDKGRVRLGFNVGGTYEKPVISNITTDNSVIQKKAEDKLKEGADKLLKGLFKKK